MKRLILFVCLFMPSVLFGQSAAVSGHLQDIGVTDVTTNTQVTFELQNYGGQIPRISGGPVITEVKKIFRPDTLGNISGTIFRNDSIQPTGTWYSVCIINKGLLLRCNDYLIAAATFNLATATPLNVTPNAGPNQLIVQAFPCTINSASTTWTCNHNFNDSQVWVETFDTNAVQIFPDHVDTSDPNTTTITWVNAQAGTARIMHAGSISIATNQPNAVLQNPSGAQSVANDLTLGGNVSIQGTTTATNFNTQHFNNIVMVGCAGCLYQTISFGVAALPSTGGEVWTVPNYRETLTSQLILGNAAVGNTKSVLLRLGRDTLITVNVTGGVDAIVVPNGSSIISPGAIGANGSLQGGALIQVASTANISSVVANGDKVGGQEYFAVDGLFIADNAAATVSGALLDLQSLFVPSYVNNTILTPTGHAGLRIRNNTGVGFGPFNFHNFWSNGGTIAGSQPVVIQAVASGGLMGNITFDGSTAFEHAGTGQYEFSVDGTSGASASILGININGAYCENSFAASSCFNFKDVQNWNLYGVTVAGVAGTNVVNIAESAAARAGFGNIVGLRDQTGFTNLVNDTIRGTTIPSGANNGGLPFYQFTNPAFTNVPATFTSSVVLPSAGPSAAQQHTFPAVASDTVALLNATQTLGGKTLTTPVINGASTGTGIQGTDSKLLTSGTVSGTAAPLCTDANGGATTSGCTAIPVILRVKSTSLCTTGASSFDSCDDTLTWDSSGFADTTYSPVCAGLATVGGAGQMPVLTVKSYTATTVTVTTSTQRAQTAHYAEVNCVGVHP